MTLVKGSQSPWGVIESAKIIVPNMITASHGGIWISKELEATIPSIVKRLHDNTHHPNGMKRIVTVYVFDDKRFLPVRRELERRKRS